MVEPWRRACTIVRHGIVKRGIEVAVVVAAVVLSTPAPALYGSAQTSDGGQHEKYVAVCGWIGVQASPMTVPVADSLGMTEPYGAIFDRPETGSPAANAGIEAGDVITAINGTPLMSWHDFTTRSRGSRQAGSFISAQAEMANPRKSI